MRLNFGDTDAQATFEERDILKHLYEVLYWVAERLSDGLLWSHEDNTCLFTHLKNLDQRKLVDYFLDNPIRIFETRDICDHLIHI